MVKTTRGEVLADLIGEGTRFVAARGGRGGLGNAALASPRRKAPGFALKGEPGERRELVLELKTVADVGLIGFPNAGKSSLIAAMSAARPKIANYPFTTLVPNLGVIEAGDTQFVAADVPGLIPGASQRPRTRAGLPAPRGAVRGAGTRARLRRRGAGPRPADRYGGHRGGTGRLRSSHGCLTGRPAADRGPEQDRCPGGQGTRRPGRRGARRARADRLPDFGGHPGGTARAVLRHGGHGQGRAGSRARGRAGAAGAAPRPGRRAGLRGRADRGATAS